MQLHLRVFSSECNVITSAIMMIFPLTGGFCKDVFVFFLLINFIDTNHIEPFYWRSLVLDQHDDKTFIDLTLQGNGAPPSVVSNNTSQDSKIVFVFNIGKHVYSILNSFILCMCIFCTLHWNHLSSSITGSEEIPRSLTSFQSLIIIKRLLMTLSKILVCLLIYYDKTFKRTGDLSN